MSMQASTAVANTAHCAQRLRQHWTSQVCSRLSPRAIMARAASRHTRRAQAGCCGLPAGPHPVEMVCSPAVVLVQRAHVPHVRLQPLRANLAPQAVVRGVPAKLAVRHMRAQREFGPAPHAQRIRLVLLPCLFPGLCHLQSRPKLGSGRDCLHRLPSADQLRGLTLALMRVGTTDCPAAKLVSPTRPGTPALEAPELGMPLCTLP